MNQTGDRAKLKFYAEVIGLAAIVASVLFLAYELQLSNRIAIASTEIGIRNGYSEFNRNLSGTEVVAEVMAKVQQPEAELSDAERIRVLMVVMDILNVWWSVETACDEEIVQYRTCGELPDDIRGFIGYFPGTRPVFEFVLETYPSLGDTIVLATIRDTLNQQASNTQ